MVVYSPLSSLIIADQAADMSTRPEPGDVQDQNISRLFGGSL